MIKVLSNYFLKWLIVAAAYHYFMACLYELTHSLTIGILAIMGLLACLFVPIFKTINELKK